MPKKLLSCGLPVMPDPAAAVSVGLPPPGAGIEGEAMGMAVE